MCIRDRSESDEITIVDKQQYAHPIEKLGPVATNVDLLQMQKVVKDVFVDDSVKQYIVALVAATRDHPTIYLGASPRGSLALFRTAQARALIHERDYVLPDDIKVLAESVLAHRLIIRLTDVSQDRTGRASIAELLETVPVPGTVLKQ